MARRILVGLGVLVTLSLAYPYAGSGHGVPDSMAEVRYYQGFSEWLSNPIIDYIVIGQVISKSESRFIPDTITPIEIQDRIKQNGGLAGTVVTDYTFQVSRLLKGKHLSAGDTITIVQGGGTLDGYTQETGISNPPLEVGEEAVLSLVYDPRDPTVSADHKKYTIITQPEVRYRIANGRIELMPGEWQDIPQLEEFKELKGVSEADFAQKALNALQLNSTTP